jgi:hypothetical protein
MLARLLCFRGWGISRRLWGHKSGRFLKKYCAEGLFLPEFPVF